MRKIVSAVLAAWAAILLLSGCGGKTTEGKKEILLLCGGSMRAPMEAVVASFNGSQSLVEVMSSYGGSGDLMAQLQQSNKGDVYVCHDPFMEWGVKQGIVDRWTTVGYLDVVIVVPRGNPKNIRSLHDLARPGLRIGGGDDRYSTSGYIINSILDHVPYADSIRANIVMQTKGHQQRANDVVLGSLDATFIWNAVARVYQDKIDTIAVPKEYIDAVTSATYNITDLKQIKVTVGVTAHGARKKHVLDFYRFIEQKSPPIFAQHGMTPVAGADR